MQQWIKEVYQFIQRGTPAKQLIIEPMVFTQDGTPIWSCLIYTHQEIRMHYMLLQNFINDKNSLDSKRNIFPFL